MPGFAFGGGNVFIAALLGFEGVYLGMDLMNVNDPSDGEWTEFGLLGVPIGYCSSMHQAEKVSMPAEVTECFKLPEEIRRDYPDDIYVDYGSTPHDAWEKIRAKAEHRGLIVRHKIGKAACMLFKARPVVGLYEHALRTDPLGLFGIKHR